MMRRPLQRHREMRTMQVLYFYFFPGPQQRHDVASLRDLAQRCGARCLIEPDQDGVGVTVTAPDNSATLTALLLGIVPVWRRPSP